MLDQDKNEQTIFQAAVRLAEDIHRHFRDPQGGFFDTRDEHSDLITRPKDIQDNATPSGNALAATALLELAAYGDRTEWRSLAEDGLERVRTGDTSFAEIRRVVDLTRG